MMFPIYLFLLCACVSAEPNRELMQKAEQLMQSGSIIQPFRQQFRLTKQALDLLLKRLYIGGLIPDILTSPNFHFVVLTSVLHDAALSLTSFYPMDYHEAYKKNIRRVVPLAWQEPHKYAERLQQAVDRSNRSISNLENVMADNCQILNDFLCNAYMTIYIQFNNELKKEAHTLQDLAKFSDLYIKHDSVFWSVATEFAEVPYLLRQNTEIKLKKLVEAAAQVAKDILILLPRKDS